MHKQGEAAKRTQKAYALTPAFYPLHCGFVLRVNARSHLAFSELPFRFIRHRRRSTPLPPNLKRPLNGGLIFHRLRALLTD